MTSNRDPIDGPPETDAELTLAYYERLSLTYDDAARAAGWSANFYLSKALEEIAVRPKRVLDLGCGTGQSTQIVLERFSHARVTMVDVAVGMLARALSQPHLELVNAEASEFLATVEPDFDLVISIGLLELLPDPLGAVVGVCRALRNGGEAIWLFTNEGVGGV